MAHFCPSYFEIPFKVDVAQVGVDGYGADAALPQLHNAPFDGIQIVNGSGKSLEARFV